MPFLTPGFILLAIVGALVALLTKLAKLRVEDARAALSADDLKTFGEKYRSRANRNDFAAASDTASRLWMFSVLPIVAALGAYIYLGATVGLPFGETP